MVFSNINDASATINTPKPIRPYTEYNIFFQLEREYILQILLGVKPNLESSERFDPDNKDYQGPFLPSRYKNLILPYDWYIPGKARRRKRKHRKSHGKIGFHELSLKIADAWSKIDGETRTFCACLSDIGMLQYKSAMRKYKLARSTGSSASLANHLSLVTKELSKITSNTTYTKKISKQNKSLSELVTDAKIPTEEFSYPRAEVFRRKLVSSLDKEVEMYLTFLRSKILMSRPRNPSSHLVDMGDDEIMDLWKSNTKNI